MFDEKTKEFLESKVNSRNLKHATIDSQPKYYLTHNKECAAFRHSVMQDADDFKRGHLFGTACICNGAEDHILDKVDVKITRYYTSGNFDLITEQTGAVLKPDAMTRLEKTYRSAAKVKTIKNTYFTDEVITEVTQNY